MSDHCDICLRSDDDNPELEMSITCSECLADSEESRRTDQAEKYKLPLGLLERVACSPSEVRVVTKLSHGCIRNEYKVAALQVRCAVEYLRKELKELEG